MAMHCTALRAHERSDPEALLARAEALRREKQGMRARDVAAALGVSEGELVAARCGQGVVRLQPCWPDIVNALPRINRVMALTRNEYIVHEKRGCYRNVSVSEKGGLVLDPDIDLRIFFDRWGFGFAVEEETPHGLRRSLQFFDRDGTAVHKVYLTEDSDGAACDALVAEFTAPDQSRVQAVEPTPARAPDPPDDEIDVAELRNRWLALNDVHDFHGMLKDLGVGRQQAFRLVGTDLARPLPPARFRRAIEKAAADRVPVMIFVGSPGVIQIHSGPVETLRVVGPWFNVLDKGFNLHLYESGVASAWLVRKPSTEGTITSVEVFDADGGQLAWMFGQRKPGQPEREDWRQLAESLGD